MSGSGQGDLILESMDLDSLSGMKKPKKKKFKNHEESLESFDQYEGEEENPEIVFNKSTNFKTILANY